MTAEQTSDAGITIRRHKEHAKLAEQLRHRGRMVILCPDRPGIVASVSQFLWSLNANIVQSDQYSFNPQGEMFCMRIEFDLSGLVTRLDEVREQFAAVAEPFEMKWRIESAFRKPKLAIFVSREDHCLLELLWQWQSGALYADIAAIVGNHQEMAAQAESFGLPFHHIPVTAYLKAEAEAKQLQVLADGEVDTVVLARYMQIISPRFIAAYPNRIINIHHSFLPAFSGGKPYTQAFERGVKIIGATAHYVTEELDAGPIIEQDVQRVSHKAEVEDLKRIGQHVERVVLARAVSWHVQDRVLAHGNKTVVFN